MNRLQAQPQIRRSLGAARLRRLFGLALLSLLGLSACTKIPPPQPTVASVEASRDGAHIKRGNTTLPIVRNVRLEVGSEVTTPAGVRASLYLDAGAWVLLDQSSQVTIRDKGIEVKSGRAWIDARVGNDVPVVAQGVELSAQRAGLAVTITDGGAKVYCASGQAAWKRGDKAGRLESGLTLLVSGEEAKQTAQALWDDFTLGLAEPGPLRALEPAGVGQLTARPTSGIGTARTPLIVRSHEVTVTIDGDLATTRVEQTFFNPRSEYLEGLYIVRLPESAILEHFSVAEDDRAPRRGVVLPMDPKYGGVSSFAANLEWAGAGRYRGLVRNIAPGKVRRVVLLYREWLPHIPHPDAVKRTYVYPMGQSAQMQAGTLSNLGEFSLTVDVSKSGAAALQAGMGAQLENSQVTLRRSDFRPTADFVLDLIDGKDRISERLFGFRGEELDGQRYLLIQPTPAPGKAPKGLDVVLLVDVSAGTDEAKLSLGRSVAQAVLKRLTPEDRVAVVAASLGAATLSSEAMAPATKERIEQLDAQLAKQTPGGATNLQLSFQRAVELLPRGQGAVIYIGDGRPTVGALTPRELREQLQRLGDLPRFFAAAVGTDANLPLLESLCHSGIRSGVVRIDDAPDASRAALYLLERIAQPSLTNVTVDLGEGADVVYPDEPVTLESGDALTVVARLPKDRGLPGKLQVRGVRDGQPFVEQRDLTVRTMDDGGDIARRWALLRMQGLLERASGKEAIVDIGKRFQVVTPWSAIVVEGSGGETYRPLVGDLQAGQFVPPALRGAAPQDSSIVLESGVSTANVRTISVNEMYVRALNGQSSAARLCYERRAAGNPGLSGRVELKVKLGLDGIPKDVRVSSSTLRSKEIDACIERALLAVKLPASPDGKLHDIDYALQLNQPDRDDGPQRCSAASRAYLQVRRSLWRERLASHPGVEGAMTVYREAAARCELKTWLDRRAIIDMLRVHVGATAQQVDLYHRFDDSENAHEIQTHLRREILRAVRTEADIRAAQSGLALDGGVDQTLLAQELKKAKSVDDQLVVVRRFLLLAPDSLSLKLKLLALLEEASGEKGVSAERKQALFSEANRLIETTRSDPGADASVRQAVGEYLIRRGEGQEGARALSEIVEFAPFDPWGRRRLGDLYRAHGFYDAAYREYQGLSWLLPQDEAVMLLLADAAAGLGRSDEALRLTSRVAEAVGAQKTQKGAPAWARALYAVRLSRLVDDAQKKGDQNLLGQLKVRGRSDGLAGYAGKLLIAVTWSHPDAQLQLQLQPPGRSSELTRAALQGGSVGIEAQRFDRIDAGEWKLRVYKSGGDAASEYLGELTVIQNAGDEAEVILRKPISFSATSGSVRDFVLRGKELSPAK